MATRDVKFDKEFQALLDPLSPEEKRKLRAKLEKEGQTEDLIGWEEAGILVDGHNRYAILESLGQTPRIDWRSFGPADDPKSRDAVIDWIVANQLGRRNLPDKRYDYFLGKKYLEELKKNRRKEDTARKVAAESGKSEATVRRAARKAKAIDEVAKTDPEKATRMKAGKEKPPKPEKKKRQGAPKFDHKRFEAAFGIVKRGPDDLIDAYPDAPAAAKASARVMNQKWNEVWNAWTQLVKVVTGS